MSEAVVSNSRWTRPNITPGSWRQNAVAVRHDIHDVLTQDGATVAFIPGKGPHRAADGKAVTAVPKMLAALEKIYEGAKETDRNLAREALIEAGYTFNA